MVQVPEIQYRKQKSHENRFFVRTVESLLASDISVYSLVQKFSKFTNLVQIKYRISSFRNMVYSLKERTECDKSMK